MSATFQNALGEKLDVVIALWHFLPRLGAQRGIPEQKYANFVAVVLGQGACQAEAVVAALGAIGWVVEYEKGRNYLSEVSIE